MGGEAAWTSAGVYEGRRCSVERPPVDAESGRWCGSVGTRRKLGVLAEKPREAAEARVRDEQPPGVEAPMEAPAREPLEEAASWNCAGTARLVLSSWPCWKTTLPHFEHLLVKRKT